MMLFDEVTSALDPELVGDVLKVMRDLADGGHDDARGHPRDGASPRQVADRVVFMDEGAIVEQGDPAQVLEHPTQERTQRFLQRVLDR